MATVSLTSENFDQITSGEGIVLVDFWASWCGPCMRFAPIYEAAAERHPDVTFAKVDTEANQDIAIEYDIRSIPTLWILRDGVMLFAQPGMLPGAALDELIGQARELNMDEIKAQAAAQSA